MPKIKNFKKCCFEKKNKAKNIEKDFFKNQKTKF